MFYRHKKLFFCICICLSIIAAVAIYTGQKTSNAVEIIYNGKVIGYAKDSNSYKSLEKNVFSELQKNFDEIVYKDQVILKKVYVDGSLTDQNNISNAIKSITKCTAQGFALNSDGKKLCVLKNQDDCKEAISLIKRYYYSRCGLKNISELDVKNSIKYTKEQAVLNDILTPEEAALSIINKNEMLYNPLITVRITGTKEETASVPFKTVTVNSDKVQAGKTNLATKGKSGSKIIVNQLIFENSSPIQSKVFSEKIVVSPVNEILQKGVAKAAPKVAAKVAKNTTASNTAASNTTSKDVSCSSSPISIPVVGSISSGFGMRWGKMHQGVDIASPMGAPIHATIAGTVIFSGWESGYGNLLEIDCGNGLVTLYGHCSVLLVKKGVNVKKGDVIAKVGSTGNSTGPHVHFEIRINGVAKNPLELLKANQ